jgi:hypothetical protein
VDRVEKVEGGGAEAQWKDDRKVWVRVEGAHIGGGVEVRGLEMGRAKTKVLNASLQNRLTRT